MELNCVQSHRSLNTLYVWPPPKPYGISVVSTFANCNAQLQFGNPFPEERCQTLPTPRDTLSFKKKNNNLTVPEMCLN